MTPNVPEPQNQLSLTLDTVLMVPARLAVDRKTLKPEEQLLLALADGRGPVSEILRLSGMPGTATMRMLRSLCERGCLQTVGRSATPAGTQLLASPAAAQPITAPRARLTQDLTDFIGRLAEGRSEPQIPAVVQAEDPFERAKPAPDTNRATLLGLEPVTPRKTAPAPAKTALYSTAKLKEAAAKEAAAKAAATTRTGTIATQGVMSGVIDRPGSGPDPALDKPTRIGAYEVVARMAQGGVGSIYLCRREGARSFQRLYALKVIRQHSAEAEVAARSLLREARVGSLLGHPNLLPIVDLGHYQDQPFLLMDYVEGTNLAELLHEGVQYPPKLILPVLIDVLRGLARAHDLHDEEGRHLGLVHGDLSPHNILVGTDGAARLTDFGSAKFTAVPEDKDGEAATMAKPAYMAPEQLKGEPIDARTDLFSVGVVLWTALTGRKLFVEPTYEQTVVNVLRRPVLPPSSFGAPRELDDVCLKALSRNASGRFQSAEEMGKALTELAVADGALPGVRAVGEWVRQSIAEVLRERRQRLKDVATGVTAPVIVSADGFEVADTISDQAEPPAPERPDPDQYEAAPRYDSSDDLEPARKPSWLMQALGWILRAGPR